MWSNWTERITCTTPVYLRFRLCPDCSKKRYHTHCSHHTRSVNSTCVMVEGRGGAFKPRFASKRQVLMDCEVKCSSTVNILTLALVVVGCVALFIIGFLCAYFLMNQQTHINTIDTTQQDVDTTQYGNDTTQHSNDTTEHSSDLT